MTEVDLIVAGGASVVTGGVSALATVKALGVHITYIREQLVEHRKAIRRAHERDDNIEAELSKIRMTILRLHPGEKI